VALIAPHDALRITDVRALISPRALRDALPLNDAGVEVVTSSRRSVTNIVSGVDDRLLVVVGPCSIHDPVAALDYATRLATLARELEPELCVVMRAYFEKPRTTLGWKGLINDPLLDGSFDMNRGIHVARAVILEIVALGLPVACEFLDPVMAQYLADVVSWGAIGARTVQSQIHRQLASGLPMPVGFKNSTEGDVQVAVDAIAVASSAHTFSAVGEDGQLALFSTAGNRDSHVVLRGGSSGPNFDRASVSEALGRLELAGLPRRVVVDASHGNSAKDDQSQPAVAQELAWRIALGDDALVGLMLESFLVPGRQTVMLGRANELTYGQSITDGCIGWSTTEEVLTNLAGAVTRRRDAALLAPSPSVA
jgi:3-deoxy-7-phosphoheptulonate synthase